MQLDNVEFVKLFLEAGYEPRSYSGRGMYGAQCVSIDTEDQGFEIGMKIAQVLFNRYLFDEGDEQYSDNNPPIMPDDIMEFISNDIKSDNMGLGYVVYFPQVEWNSEIQEFVNNYVEQGEE